ncbi:hypothetical protein IQ238_01060 [Pleurocapsales cyanobacterium LEGE 06147]|nr:hypothetical protein [Pleurocapsales cyanobacterium LEGE 06147]
MSNNARKQIKQESAQRKIKLAQKHQKIAEKTGNKLVEHGKLIQEKNPCFQEQGEFIEERGKQINELARIQEQTLQAAIEKEESLDEFYQLVDKAEQQQLQANQAHTKAIKKYNEII